MGWFARARARARARHPPDGDPARRRARRARAAGGRGDRRRPRRAARAWPGSRSSPRWPRSCGCATRRRPPPGVPAPTGPPPTRDRAHLAPRGRPAACSSSAQAALLGFVVLFLHDERGLSARRWPRACSPRSSSAARSRASRVGRRSDRERRCASRCCAASPLARRRPARRARGARRSAPGRAAVPRLARRRRSPRCRWNGLAFTAAAEIAGRRRAGTAMSLQNTIVSVGGALAPAALRRCSSTRRAGRSASRSARWRRRSPGSSWRRCSRRRGRRARRARAQAGAGRSLARVRAHEQRPSSTADVQSGLEGVVAFATEIAEPDKEGGALRYRGVDIEDLVGKVPVRAGLGPARRRRLRAGPAAGRAARR